MHGMEKWFTADCLKCKKHKKINMLMKSKNFHCNNYMSDKSVIIFQCSRTTELFHKKYINKIVSSIFLRDFDSLN